MIYNCNTAKIKYCAEIFVSVMTLKYTLREYNNFQLHGVRSFPPSIIFQGR